MSSVENFGSEHSLSFYFDLNKSLFGDIWKLNYSASADYNNTEAMLEGEDLGYKSWDYYFGLRNTVTLSKKHGWTVGVDYNYSSPLTGMTKVYDPANRLGTFLNKKFDYGGQLNFMVLNLLNYRAATHYDSPTYYYAQSPKTNLVYYELKYSHYFGRKKQVSRAQNRTNTKYKGRYKNQ